MDFNSMTLFSAIKKRMSWLSTRQEVLAQNIANSDTPGFRPKDLKELDFKRLIDRERSQIRMVSTRHDHLKGEYARQSDFEAQNIHRPYETAPAGNAVVLEEQMLKVNKTAASHKLVNELYRKHLTILRTALGKK